MIYLNPTISIIIPVYNTEKYLRRCLDSIVAQTYKDFECILIDDGSTDSSGKICDEYAAKDNRFRVIHKENGGVATARQAGTDVAKGEYIIHADPDDWTEPEMLEQMYAKARETDADVTICDFYITDKYGESIRIDQNLPFLQPHDLLCELFHRLYGSLWNKLAKRSCYKKYGLYFTPRINYCEDLLIWVQLFQHPEVKVAYLDKAFYHYYKDNEGSITHSKSKEVIETKRRYYQKLDELLPIGDKYFAKLELVKYYIYLWQIGYLNDKEFRDKHINNNDIKSIVSRRKLIYAALLLNNGHGKIARFLLNLKRPWKRHK